MLARKGQEDGRRGARHTSASSASNLATRSLCAGMARACSAVEMSRSALSYTKVDMVSSALSIDASLWLTTLSYSPPNIFHLLAIEFQSPLSSLVSLNSQSLQLPESVLQLVLSHQGCLLALDCVLER